ncbi:MAG: polyphosphate kinase 2 family protein [bacterium]
MATINLTREFIVQPGAKVRLDRIDPAGCAGFADKAAANGLLEKDQRRLEELRYLLFAESRAALLVVLQGLDAAGKDGVVRQVMLGVSPQSCRVTSFRVPSAEELAHDFLWRVHRAVPGRGEIGIFNRSHYEDVLIVRVHNLVPEKRWRGRYDEINDFERMLARNGTHILKFFLHISRDEQRRRLQQRLADPTKNWKMSLGDLREREHWDDYQQAYEEALSRCSTDWAPWFVIPSDRKWFRNLAISEIIVEKLESLKMRFPKPDFDPTTITVP